MRAVTPVVSDSATPWTVGHQAPLSMSFLGKNTGAGYHLLQGIFLTQGSNPCLLCLLHWQTNCLPLGSPQIPPPWEIKFAGNGFGGRQVFSP